MLHVLASSKLFRGVHEKSDVGTEPVPDCQRVGLLVLRVACMRAACLLISKKGLHRGPSTNTYLSLSLGRRLDTCHQSPHPQKNKAHTTSPKSRVTSYIKATMAILTSKGYEQA
jgi:hypothetical protein